MNIYKIHLTLFNKKGKRMIKLRNLLVYIGLTVVFSSCNSILVYHMDVLCPGIFVTPSSKSSMLLVDNAAIQPSQYGHTFLEAPGYKEDSDFHTDQLPDYVLQSVSDNLRKEGAYQQISLCKKKEYDFHKNKVGDFLLSRTLTPLQVKSLSDSSHADILVSLDRLVVYSKMNVQPDDYSYRVTRDVIVNTVWRAYDVRGDSLLTQFQHNDSLYWENFSGDLISSIKKLPSFEETLPEIGNYVGEHVHQFFGPYWKSLERFYYSFGSFRMKYAVDCVRQGDWEGAATLWQDEFKKGFGRSVYRAALNMMLYHEYSGDPEEALVWADQAEKAMNDFLFGATIYDKWLFVNYKEALRVRAFDLKKLKIYFNDK